MLADQMATQQQEYLDVCVQLLEQRIEVIISNLKQLQRRWLPKLKQLDEADNFVLSCDHVAFVSKFREILVKSQNYPENIETFKTGLRDALNVKSKLVQKLLSGCTISIPDNILNGAHKQHHTVTTKPWSRQIHMSDTYHQCWYMEGKIPTRRDFCCKI